MTVAVLPAAGVIPVVGLHEYVPVPVGRPAAESVLLSPKHKLGFELLVMLTEEAIVTLILDTA